MHIGRKEALLVLIAGLIPWRGRRASAQERILREPRVQSPEVVELQRRVVALEAQLANLVGFTRDGAGNLQLRGNASITIDAATSLTMRGGAQTHLAAGANNRITGATIALN